MRLAHVLGRPWERGAKPPFQARGRGDEAILQRGACDWRNAVGGLPVRRIVRKDRPCAGFGSIVAHSGGDEILRTFVGKGVQVGFGSSDDETQVTEAADCST